MSDLLGLNARNVRMTQPPDFKEISQIVWDKIKEGHVVNNPST